MIEIKISQKEGRKTINYIIITYYYKGINYKGLFVENENRYIYMKQKDRVWVKLKYRKKWTERP